MPVIGLTGGIASGKSTVAAMLRARGAIVHDADLIARELVEPGMPALEEIRERFGAGIVDSDGRLDRPALGAIVFSDAGARKDLEGILHPRIFAELRRRIAEHDPAKIQVVEAALLVESAPWDTGELDLEALVVVESDPEVQIARLVSSGRMSQEDARLRLAAQTRAEARSAAATYIIDNNGSPNDLTEATADLWGELSHLGPSDLRRVT